MASVSVKLVSMLVIGLLIGGGGVFGVMASQKSSVSVSTVTSTSTVTIGSSAQTNSQTSSSSLSGVIPIGIAYELTGSISDYGVEMAHAAQLAISDMNTYLSQVNASYHFKGIVVDTQSTPSGALQAVQQLVQTDGVQVVVGPLLSGEVQALQSYVNTQHIVLISCCSNAPGITSPGGYIFRTIPPSSYQGSAMADEALNSGVTQVVAITIQNDFATGVMQAFNQTFSAGGGKLVQVITYSPSETDHSAEVSQLASDIQQIGVGPHTGVAFVAYTTDGLDVLSKATQYSSLSSVPWFCDLNCPTTSFLPPSAPASIAQFMVKTNMTATPTAVTQNYAYSNFVQEYKSQYGASPLPEVENSYDSAMLALFSIVTAGSYSGPVVRAAVSNVAYHLFGSVGPLRLNANGDLMSGTVAIEQIEYNGTAYNWVTIANYDIGTGKLTPSS